jgi:hypothetical protein
VTWGKLRTTAVTLSVRVALVIPEFQASYVLSLPQVIVPSLSEGAILVAATGRVRYWSRGRLLPLPRPQLRNQIFRNQGATPADASTAAVERARRKGVAMIDHVGRGVLDQMQSATRSVPHYNLLTFSVVTSDAVIGTNSACELKEQA